MSDHLWFYELLNEVHGPISTEQVQQLIAEGRLFDTDRIRPQTSEEWITVADLRTLVESVASGEDEWEEVTELDDLNFQFEDSSAGIERVTESRMGTVEGEIDDRHSDLDINAFQLSGDPEQARHSAFASKAGNATWLVKSQGQPHGPMAMTELLAMAESGQLSGNDRIRQAASDTWVAAKSIPEVASVLADPGSKTSGAASRSGGRSAAAGKSGQSAQSRSKGRPQSGPGRKRRRKKKRSEKDQLLAEIFSDVFAEDGKVRDLTERPDLAKPAAPAAAATGVAGVTGLASSPSMAGNSDPAVQAGSFGGSPAPISPGLSSPSGMAAMSGAAGGAAAAAAAARPKFVPPPKKRKKSGGGGGFSVEPQVLAAGAGVLVVIGLIVAGFMGVLPSFGFGVDGTATFAEFEKEFTPMVDKVVPDAEWEAFRNKYLGDARAISKSAMTSAGTDPASAETLKSALLMIRIIEYSQDEAEARKKTFDSFKEWKK